MDIDTISVKEKARLLAEEHPAERAKRQARIAFLVSRAEYLDARDHRKTEKGREINARKLPPGSEADFEEARLDEWQKHIDHDVFDIRYDLSGADLQAQGKTRAQHAVLCTLTSTRTSVALEATTTCR